MPFNDKNATLLSESLRKQLAGTRELGCGNFLHIAVKTNPNASLPFLWMDRYFSNYLGETFEHLSLVDLKRIADGYAALYYGNGIREKDPVAVYINEGVGSLVHFIALTGIGAIPILINGNMKPEIAAGFIEKTGAVALYTDSSHQSRVAAHLQKETLKFIATDELAIQLAPPILPQIYPYVHEDNDTVLVGHSSGTTGIPKAVIFQHQQFFYGPRYRLGLPAAVGAERIVSALPHSHSAGLAYVMLALLNGSSTMVLSNNKPETVLQSIEAFRPTMVVAFPETFVELCQEDFSQYDFSSIQLWMNGGDAAHETHVRKLISVGNRQKNGQAEKGSIFIDGLGSSEMGFSLFRMVHTPESSTYNRCIGTPLEWVDAAIIGEEGEKLPTFQVGKLGVKSPSITPGYWNDSELTMRSRVKGYWLTGDLFYRDEQHRFFHVDRIPDAIRTKKGVLYSLQTEELLMQHFSEIADCTVIGIPEAKSLNVPVALVRLRSGAEVDTQELLERFNSRLQLEGKIPLGLVLLAKPGSIPLGPTGKVLKRELREQYLTLFQNKSRLSQEGVSHGSH